MIHRPTAYARPRTSAFGRPTNSRERGADGATTTPGTKETTHQRGGTALPRTRVRPTERMTNEWVEWHRQYEDEGLLTARLRVVQKRIHQALDRNPVGPIQVLSMCAGDGRDLLGVLADHPRKRDVKARLVELSPELVASGRERLRTLHLPSVKFVQGDASSSDAYEGVAPANLLLVCGIFGNITDEDILRTIGHLPELSSRGATVVWTRGRFAPDLTPTIRKWFREAGFEESSFDTIPDTTASVGVHRLTTEPRPYRRGVRLFTFLEKEDRPSERARRADRSSGAI